MVKPAAHITVSIKLDVQPTIESIDAAKAQLEALREMVEAEMFAGLDGPDGEM
jgi:hypothetical protein